MKRTLLASAVCLALVTACGQQDTSMEKQAEASKEIQKESAEKSSLKSGIELA